MMCLLLNRYGTFALQKGAHMQSSPCSVQFDGAANTLRIVSKQQHRLQGVDKLASIKRYRHGEEICGEGCPAVYWFVVMSGGARRCVSRADGRRQIIELMLPGDVFGFCPRNEYNFSAEALADDTHIAYYPRQRIEALAETDPALARELRVLAFEAISRSRPDSSRWPTHSHGEGRRLPA
jgi:CRP-like cAMP-binding protein